MGFFILLVITVVVSLAIFQAYGRYLVWRRLAEEPSDTPQFAETRDRHADMDRDWLTNWLYRAGFRQPSAPLVFILATLVTASMAFGMVYAVRRVGLIDLAADMLYSIPGGVGNVMVPFALAAPWFVAVVISLVPVLVVRAVRRKRVEAIQQDLPLLLDLLNTLAQAGIGFDAALERILSSQPQGRPLIQEFRLFQFDTFAGRSRIQSLRRLMNQVSVPLFSSFISALIQAEQSGGGMAATLRVQAAEIRSRRRERATAAAMAVPTKLVVPMVIGFLPGIFVVLLGPMINEAFGMMGQMMRGVSGQ